MSSRIPQEQEEYEESILKILAEQLIVELPSHEEVAYPTVYEAENKNQWIIDKLNIEKITEKEEVLKKREENPKYIYFENRENFSPRGIQEYLGKGFPHKIIIKKYQPKVADGRIDFKN